MASLYKEKNQAWRIMFGDGNGRRRSVRLGKMTKKAAETIRSRVEEMIACRLAGTSLSPETATWLGNLPNDMLQRLSSAGFTVQARHTTDELYRDFQKQKCDVKQATLDLYENNEKRFFAFFEQKTNLQQLSSQQFEDWKTFLKTDYRSPHTGKPLVESTVANTITQAKAVFNWAVKQGWIDQSPLDGVGCGSFINHEKDRFVTHDEYRRLLDACPCQD